MTPGDVLAVVLAAAVAVAWLRLLLQQRRVRGAFGRFALLMLLQPLCAGLLYLTLLPPVLPGDAGTLTVLTAGATRELLASQTAGETVVALPEVPRMAGAEPVPDLATAIRRHPGAAQLQVIGHGLGPRDRPAVRGHALRPVPPPLPRGLVRLDAGARVVAGAAFPVTGRVNALEGGRVQLVDPAGQVVDRGELDPHGRFRLHGHARAPGPATFIVQVLDAGGDEVETAAVPLLVADDPAPRVLLLSGAPNPEFRHLRRWASDAGLELHVEVAVGGGVGLGDGPAPADAEGFGRFDLVILDERALAGLGASRRAALGTALAAGTGVLLRVTGAAAAPVRAHMAELGLAVTGDDATEPVVLPHVDDPQLLRARMGPGSVDAPFDPALAQEAPPELLRRTLRPRAEDAVPLDVDGVGAGFAWWRARGRGRVGLWTLVDSYRLGLAGRGDLTAGLWSAAVSTLARAPEGAPPRFHADARAGTRTVICGLADDVAEVTAPDRSTAVVLVDPAAGPDRCGAYWPAAAGWHLLRAGGEAWPFHVRAADELPGVAAAALQDATQRLAGGAVPAAPAGTGKARPGPSWPWFIAWLAVTCLLWWIERRPSSRAGTKAAISGGDALL